VVLVLASELVLLMRGVLATIEALLILLLLEGPESGTMEDEAVIPILRPIRGCKGMGIPVVRMECIDEVASRLL
jgi:hypothetical protein